MLPDLLSDLQQELDDREEKGLLRTLSLKKDGIDFCSNDYLGFARSQDFKRKLLTNLQHSPQSLQGSTGSRLITGNSEILMELEAYLAQVHQVESALIFPSGFNANLSLFSVLPKRQDTLLLDEKVHRSVFEGSRLSNAKRWKFRHNDLNHLEELLKKSSGRVWVAIESLYSMNGDFAALVEIAGLCSRYSAALIVDEAHAIGTFGLGLVNYYGLQEQVFATVVTYGKAMGQSGAAVLGSKTLIQYLINYSPSFIYSTGLPDFHALGIRSAYEFLEENEFLRKELQRKIRNFNSDGVNVVEEWLSPIIPIYIQEEHKLSQAQNFLREQGIISYPVKAPTVAKEEQMLRVILHSFNTEREIDLLKACIIKIQDE
ncbi:aminotransferase class I/II-fold pyridoxal phosphate-dependent enzyme [Sphingobacterium cellulitidis]|uniref:aminotransferase class I/II-fold pyridoxal phosphate-dependent enzyme n=1 Tax=Sphingobacterium cellulitidis TaxID=1768011 RepID=UPI003C7A100F